MKNNDPEHQSTSAGNQTPASHDVAVFLDLDNVVIGAKQANLNFDINLILAHIKETTNGRIVLRRSYGDWRQSQKLLQELTAAGFATQSTVRLNSFSKNLADMQIVVDTMDTLIDGHQYSTYVLITGDRDFTPLVQSLRKRGKQVIGIGLKHTASSSLVSLCDQYTFYEALLPDPHLADSEMEALLVKALDALLKNQSRVRASVLKQYMMSLNGSAFNNTYYTSGNFSKFLARYPTLIEVQQEGTTTYVRRLQNDRTLHLRYRSGLKKQKLRVVPAPSRFVILKDLITMLQQEPELRWRQLVDLLNGRYRNNGSTKISKNMVNAVLLLARRAQVIRTLKGESLATAPVRLQIKEEKAFQEAIIRCDAAYLQEILTLSEPFDLEEAAIALYNKPAHKAYLQLVMSNLDKLDQ